MTIVGPWTARQLAIGVGYVFPIYKSSRALRRRHKPELLQWITFWTVSALFWLVELVGDTIISWLPFYFEAKIAFLLWLVLPQYNGARVLHETYIAPLFVKHEDVIDVTILDIKRRAGETVVQVCKDTAALAIRRGSGVVSQGQQYVAAQLVQQALGKFQQSPPAPESQELRVPAILSFLSAAATPSSPNAAPRKSIVSPPTTSEAKEERTENSSEEKVQSEGTKSEAKQPASDIHSDIKTVESPSATPKGLPPSKPRSPRRVPTPPIPPPNRNQEKSKELVAHFKRLLVKGFQLKYYPSEGVLKNRTLRLVSAQSRYLVFESSTGDSKNRKSVTLFIHNVRRVASIKAGEPGISSSVDDSLAFVLDNGKTTLMFEADSSKTRDLLVAGMRLLVNEHKRDDTIALGTITTVFDRLVKQRAFDQMIYALTSTRTKHQEVEL